MSRSAQGGALAVARAYHDAWQRRDYQAAWQFLGDDLVVDVPVNSYDSKTAFAAAAERTREMAAAVTPIAEFGNHGEAVLLYDMTLPIGDLRIAEYFRVHGGRITGITHIHDTAALRDAQDREVTDGITMAAVTPDQRYEELVQAFLRRPGVTQQGRGFGSSALKVGGKMFATLSVSGAFVVKLPRQRVAALVAAGHGRPFQPGPGRVMKQWLEVSPESGRNWASLAEEALAFVGGVPK